MVYKIKQFFESIYSLIHWFKIIWKDRNWDSYYYEVMLLHKITAQRKYFEKRQFFVGWENEVKWMKKCEHLLTMLVKSKYWEDEWIDKKPTRNGLNEGSYKAYYDGLYSKDYKNNLLYYCPFVDVWENKTRNLFWKIFVWRYERWWD